MTHSADDQRLLDYLTTGSDGAHGCDPGGGPSSAAGRGIAKAPTRVRASGGEPRVSDGRRHPVDVSHLSGDGLRRRALAEAARRGVPASKVRAAGPGRYEFYIT